MPSELCDRGGCSFAGRGKYATVARAKARVSIPGPHNCVKLVIVWAHLKAFGPRFYVLLGPGIVYYIGKVCMQREPRESLACPPPGQLLLPQDVANLL